ncbi:REP-associated tyrosine transposase [Flammeovirga aprica]|uniref:Transposase n=1 Tax=Flammeovirga aprica JL-4 TaxID=694437 RepID=A0A7X9P3B6_9BACT|nr:transposase [Flammeovirga aprica]NME67632.1 transposase [Flammeovirga aprica JL-4]
MSRKYKILDQTKCYFVTLTVVHWIDVFTRKEYKDIIIDSLKYCQNNKGLALHAYVIMTNHIHLIISNNEDNKLEYILRDMKKFTSLKIINAIKDNPVESRKKWLIWMFEKTGQRNKNNTRYQFWQQHNCPKMLTSSDSLSQKLNYIHDNPLKEGIVNEPDEYLYSSAGNYSGKMLRVLDVELI